MAKRQSRETPPLANTDLGFRTRLPRQLSGRVTQDTFDQYEALRDTLRTHNGELFTRGAEALIQRLAKDDRRDYELFLQRIRRQRAR
jgi:hypothetical protein